MSDEAEKLGTELSFSSYKNLLRKISTRLKELNFVHQSHNNVLVYPNNLKVEDLTYLTFSAVHSFQVNQEQVRVQVRVQELHDLKIR